MSSQADPLRTAPEQEGHPINHATQAPACDAPAHVGRYRVERVLGEGTFGRVYLAHDDKLDRAVAIKLPHRHLVSQPGDVEAYLAEARVHASLEHDNIVPVLDVGTTEDGLPFVVSKFIERLRLRHGSSPSPLRPAAYALTAP